MVWVKKIKIGVTDLKNSNKNIRREGALCIFLLVSSSFIIENKLKALKLKEIPVGYKSQCLILLLILFGKQTD